MFQCFVNLALRPLLFLWTDQPNRAQPSSLLWSEDCVCSCCVCFVCTNHPHTQWRVNLCWYEATWGLWLQEVQSKAWTHSLSPPCFVLHISQRSLFVHVPRQFLGGQWFSPAKSILLAYSWATSRYYWAPCCCIRQRLPITGMAGCWAQKLTDPKDIPFDSVFSLSKKYIICMAPEYFIISFKTRKVHLRKKIWWFLIHIHIHRSSIIFQSKDMINLI